MGERLTLQRCDRCKIGGYDHRKLGLLVDGHLVAEVTLCRKDCAVDRISEAERLVTRGHEHAFSD